MKVLGIADRMVSGVALIEDGKIIAAINEDRLLRKKMAVLFPLRLNYKILGEYRKITGLPTTINTSFNMHEEPIVCTPYDAVRAFKQGALDYLATGGNYLMKGPDRRTY